MHSSGLLRLQTAVIHPAMSGNHHRSFLPWDNLAIIRGLAVADLLPKVVTLRLKLKGDRQSPGCE
ncbi:hypothetical protein [Nostoc sp. PA-18-2419]|uniref:hypothetical protein n=1 Tax=Nostoc sp. PA-18-2419 TaxID=2575443 RepID=UPI001678884B|nr:hypothetical protein [Nostoc sp. PA-18-2419]